MRIISGKRRGAKLFCVDDELIRPTTDRVKESLFSMIGEYIPGSEVLDLFAGSGALAYESVSRGAVHAVLVDCDKRSIEIMKKNCEKLGFEKSCDLIHSDTVSYLNSADMQFDIIFMDPPYNKGHIPKVLESIQKNKALKNNGIVVLESDNTDFHENINGYEIIKQKKYGRTYVTVYAQKTDTE